MVQRDESGTFRFSGALDFDVADFVLRRIDEMHSGDEEILLDLSKLVFVDAAGCGSLVRAADWLAPPHQITVINAPATLIRMLTIGGWLPHPRLVFRLAAGRDDASAGPSHPFRHEALIYDGGVEGFLAAVVPLVHEALDAGAAVKVVVGAPKLQALEGTLRERDRTVELADMADVGANPARILSAWRDFVGASTQAGRHMLGVGEPVYPERTPAELVECQLHESLLNTAFTDTVGFRLLCPYDFTNLDDAVIDAAYRSHPRRLRDGASNVCETYDPQQSIFSESLPEPRTEAVERSFAAGDLDALRTTVADDARRAGLSRERTADLVVAVNEAAANSLKHAGGHGLLRIWHEPTTVICEVRDTGRIPTPLLGRERPPPDVEGGRGLWIINQLCDLAQIRSNPDGSVVRMHATIT